MANTGYTTTQDTKTSEESLLLERLTGVEDNRAGMYSVHIRLSELRPSNRKAHYISVATRSFEPILNNFDATLYELSNCDLVIICTEVPIEEMDPSIAKVRALFSEDPLTAAEEGSIEDVFATWYDLSHDEDYYSFVHLTSELSAKAEESLKKAAEEKNAEGSRQMAGETLDPNNLNAINLKMNETQISDLIQQQSAIHIKSMGKGELLFHEHFVSMANLQKRVAPGINLFGNTWLFQYLTETIDRRVMAVIGRRDFNEMASSISVNLNISTILSKEFQLFHSNVGNNANKVVIEMQMIDICSNMGNFTHARDTLQERGYRVLIDGLSPLSLQYFEPGVLETDYVKIGWSKEFLGEIPEEHMLKIKDIISRTGSDRVILARIDNEKAIEWALNLGITRFQGYYIDTIVDAMYSKGII